MWLTAAGVASLSTPFQYISHAIDVRPDLRVFAYGVASTREMPLSPGRTMVVLSDDPGMDRVGEPFAANPTVVSSRYVKTVGLAMRQGRWFEDSESPQPRVPVINEAMARLVGQRGTE